jgi:hypothetical protein
MPKKKSKKIPLKKIFKALELEYQEGLSEEEVRDLNMLYYAKMNRNKNLSQDMDILSEMISIQKTTSYHTYTKKSKFNFLRKRRECLNKQLAEAVRRMNDNEAG